MSFRTRNTYYIRISEKNVLPLYVYLDEQHVDWMSDQILQHVLADLKPNVLPKLKEEAAAALAAPGSNASKLLTVDTIRGDTYQFCYFTRKIEPHSVLIKSRKYTAALKSNPSIPTNQASATGAAKKRKTAFPPKRERKKAKTRVSPHGIDGQDIQELEPSSSVRRSERPRKAVEYDDMEWDEAGNDADYEMDEAESAQNSSAQQPVKVEDDDELVDLTQGNENEQAEVIDLDVEEEEQKPKPLLRLNYRGFHISVCMCAIVEPWPVVRRLAPRALSVRPSGLRAPSVALPDDGSVLTRERTPLFLPDPDERDRSQTPALGQRGQRLPSVPRFDPDVDDWVDNSPENDTEDDLQSSMLQLSQVLRSTDYGGAIADDDDDFQGMALFTDADEVREI